MLYSTSHTTSPPSPSPSPSPSFSPQSFDRSNCLLSAALSFDAYTPPSSLPASRRIEDSPNGLSVTFIDTSFTSECYDGMLEVIVKSVTNLQNPQIGDGNKIESLMSGSGIDPYLLAGVVELGGSKKNNTNTNSNSNIIDSLLDLLPNTQQSSSSSSSATLSDLDILTSTFSNGVNDLTSTVHVGRSSTAWAAPSKSQSLLTSYEPSSSFFGFNKKGASATWLRETPFYLCVQDPSTATVMFSIMDDEILSEDVCVGSGVLALSSVFTGLFSRPSSNPVTVTLNLSSKPKKKSKKSQIVAGAVTGAALGGGPIGALVGGFLASNYEDSTVKGELKLDLRYLPMAKRNTDTNSNSNTNTTEVKSQHKFTSCIESIDWSSVVPPTHNFDDLSLLTIINNKETGCSCRVYRSKSEKQIVVAFRGTTLDDPLSPKDLVTDGNIAQCSFLKNAVAGDKGNGNNIGGGYGASETDKLLREAKCHAGFYESLDSISRRLKEIVVLAGDGEFEQYDVTLTGHSLGGALAMLFASDVARFGYDLRRDMPEMGQNGNGNGNGVVEQIGTALKESILRQFGGGTSSGSNR